MPTTVTGSWSDNLNVNHGPFEISGNLYVFTVDKTNNKIRAYKSADGGANWTEQDSANAPSISSTAGSKSVFVVQSGTTLYVSYLTSLSVTIRPFSADAWGSATNSSGAPTVAVGVSGKQTWAFAVRSSGDYVVFYQSSTQGIMGTQYRRFSYVVYSGGSWGTPVQIGTGVAAHYDLRAAILGASDRVEFVYTKNEVNTTYKRSLSSANALDTEQSFSASGDNAYSIGVPVAFVNGGNTEIAIPVAEGSGSFLLDVARWNSGADAAVTVTNVSGSISPDVNNQIGAMAVDSTTKYVFFNDTSSRDIYRDSDGGSNTWGTDTLQDAATCAGINANKITSAIGILFNDNGTVKYDSYSLSSGANVTGAASLTGAGSLTAAGRLLFFGAAALSGVGALTASGRQDASGAAALSGLGGLSAAGLQEAFGAAALAGLGGFTADGRQDSFGAASLAGIGALTADGFRAVFGSTVLSGLGDLVADGFASRIGAASLSGLGSLTAAGRQDASGAAALSGLGSLTADGRQDASGAALLSGLGSLAASGTRVVFGAATLSGAGALSVVGVHTAIAAALLSGQGALSANGRQDSFGAAALSGQGAATIIGVRTAFGSAVLTGIGVLTADGQVIVPAIFGAASLSGAGSLTATGVRSAVGRAALSGTGALTASGRQSAFGAAVLSGLGALVASGTLRAILNLVADSPSTLSLSADASGALTLTSESGGSLTLSSDSTSDLTLSPESESNLHLTDGD